MKMNEYLKGPKPGVMLKKVFDPNSFIVGGVYSVKTGKKRGYQTYACLLKAVKDTKLLFTYVNTESDPEYDDMLTLSVSIEEYESKAVTIVHLTDGTAV